MTLGGQPSPMRSGLQDETDLLVGFLGCLILRVSDALQGGKAAEVGLLENTTTQYGGDL
jgi:hypothetical protein